MFMAENLEGLKS